jgi:hypothetical protein
MTDNDDDNDNDIDEALEDTLTDAMYCLMCGHEVVLYASALHHADEDLDDDHTPLVSEIL